MFNPTVNQFTSSFLFVFKKKKSKPDHKNQYKVDLSLEKEKISVENGGGRRNLIFEENDDYAKLKSARNSILRNFAVMGTGHLFI